MKKTFLFIMGLSLALCYNVFAESLTVTLIFPKKANSKVSVEPLSRQVTICGNYTLDITPYPQTQEKERFWVEYYLNERLIYQTDGYNITAPDNFSFKYSLNTAEFLNGSYRLTVNYWDKAGKPDSAIGIRDIIIKNE